MKRPLIVATMTLIGLIAVLSFHTPPASLLPASSAAKSKTTQTTPAGGTAPPTTAPPTTQATPGTTPTTTTPSTQARSATGPQVNFGYGTIAVTATVTGTKLTNVKVSSLDDGGNPRSQSIDQQSIPILVSQALAAQSANIQGVSGASYTSQGFAQSLQSALSSLGVK